MNHFRFPAFAKLIPWRKGRGFLSGFSLMPAKQPAPIDNATGLRWRTIASWIDQRGLRVSARPAVGRFSPDGTRWQPARLGRCPAGSGLGWGQRTAGPPSPSAEPGDSTSQQRFRRPGTGTIRVTCFGSQRKVVIGTRSTTVSVTIRQVRTGTFSTRCSCTIRVVVTGTCRVCCSETI